MVVSTAKLGGTASDVTVARIGHGLMMMTWNGGAPVPDEQCFEAIKAGIDALPADTQVFVNSGEFYGPNLSTANLELVSRFFEKYPNYADRAFISVKGGLKPQGFEPDSSLENLRRSAETIRAALGGKKKLDLFESARVAPNVPVEEAVKNLAILVKEGLFDHIGLSECSAETLRRAHKVHPIAVVEIEVSPWSYEEETKKVIATAKELGIAVAAYSPLGRGFLTGSIKSLNDIPEDDMRRRLTRFKEENFEHNLVLVENLKAIAAKKGVAPSQLCLAWVCSLGDHIIPIPGSSHVKRTLENLTAGDITLTPEEKAEVDQVIASHDVKGDRYFGAPAHVTHLWG